MIGLRSGLSIWIATQPIDFRRGMDSLELLVSEAFGADPYDGGLYVFRSRDRVKILIWDEAALSFTTRELKGSSPGHRSRKVSCGYLSCLALGAARWLRLEACADAGCGSASTSWLILIKSSKATGPTQPKEASGAFAAHRCRHRYRGPDLPLQRLFADETPLPVLDPGRGRTKVCQFWAIATETVRGAAWRRWR
jgi:transposase